MSTKSLPIWILFIAILTGSDVFAHNWHPFPFQTAYYGRWHVFADSTNNAPSVQGYIIDGLYLDTAYQSGGNLIRKRSSIYPSYEWSGGFSFMDDVLVSTSSDSGTVSCIGSDINMVLNPQKIKPGETISYWTVLSIGTQSVLGVSDSVATLLSTSSDTIKWSKRFGIIQIGNGMGKMVLLGVKDLNLGWQDMILRQTMPSPGDKIHIRRAYEGTITCSGPGLNYTQTENEHKLFRIRIISANPDNVFVNVIESEPGSSTGVEYERIFDTYAEEDSIYPAGVPIFTNQGYDHYFGFLDVEGRSFKLKKTERIDLPTKFKLLSCRTMPLSSMEGIFPILNTIWCQGGILHVDYPVYVNIQGGCTVGSPLPDVTITSTKELEDSRLAIVPFPQPARTSFRFGDIKKGSFNIFDANGKIMKHGKLDDYEIDISGFSQGLYFYTLLPDGQQHQQYGKLLVD